MKKKYKIILIISAVAVLIVLAILIWKSSGTSEEPVVPEEGGAALPEETEGGDETTKQEGADFSLVRLSDEEVKVFGFWENPGNGEVYYITTEGVVRSAKQGPDPEISTRRFSAINKVRPEDEGSRVLVSSGDPKSPDWGMFDSGDGVWRPLPSYIKDMVWGAEEDQVFALVSTEEGQSLVSLNIEKLRSGEDEAAETLIRNFTFKDVEISFSSPSSVIIAEKPASFHESSVWKFDISKKELIKIISSKKGFVMNWDEGGLVFTYEGGNNRFSILDGDLNNAFPVPFTTFPSKCDAASRKIYCFVPYSPLADLSNMELPEDYFKNKFYTSDSLYEIDVEAEKLKRRVSMNSFGVNLDAYAPEEIAEDIYFINKYDKGLYQLKLRD